MSCYTGTRHRGAEFPTGRRAVSIFYLIGVIVVIIVVLKLLGLY